MKSGSKRFIIALALLSLTAGADAQTPREQLDQMVEQLQKTPNDNALRERIIRLGAKVKPVPTVPEEAVKFEGRAQFAFNNAKSADDYLVAAQEYEKAVVLAPWVPGYYSDLCTIYEKAGKLVEAKHNCGFYLAGVVDPAQVTDVKRRIAGLEFGIEKATKQSPGAVQAKQSKVTGTGKWRVAMVRSVQPWSYDTTRAMPGALKETNSRRGSTCAMCSWWGRSCDSSTTRFCRWMGGYRSLQTSMSARR